MCFLYKHNDLSWILKGQSLLNLSILADRFHALFYDKKKNERERECLFLEKAKKHSHSRNFFFSKQKKTVYLSLSLSFY